MKRFLIYSLSLIFIQFFSESYAEPDELLTQFLNKIQTMQANFSEIVKNTQGKTINRSQGQMSLERPGKFRWDVKKPNPQLIIINGKKLWIYDADLKQVTIRYLGKEVGEAPALLLSNSNETFANDFKVQGTLNEWFLLTPKNKNSMFQSIKLKFQDPGLQVRGIKEMQLQDHLGHITTIQFNQIVMNKQIPDSLFQFKPPARVDVIDETNKK